MKFPIDVGPPRKLIYNLQDYLAYVNLYNGKRKAIYKSIYSFKEITTTDYGREIPNYDSAVVDSLFFDFDFKSCDAYEEVKKLHEECDKQNLEHIIIFSGRGFHCYIFTTLTNLQYKKEAIRGAQQYFIDKLNLTVDRQVIGNVAQLARIPNTFHPKANRFCIPLTREQFERGDEYIKKLADKQNFVKGIIMNKELFDIIPFDKEPPNTFSLDMPKLPSNSCFNLPNSKEIPPCISKLMEDKKARYKDRYLIILYFKERGYMKEEVFKILKSCLSEKKLVHCIKEERQLQYLFGRDDLVFPSCETMSLDGFCPGKCDFYNSTVYR